MRQSRFLEWITTRHLLATVCFVLVAISTAFFVLVHYQVTTVGNLATFTDALFKAVALFIGLLWTLNRYFIQRTDVPQLRVDADVKIVRRFRPDTAQGHPALLIYRLDLVNTGKTAIPKYRHFVMIESVLPSKDRCTYDMLYRWPDHGYHDGGPIEPGSWAAVNDALPCPASLAAVRAFVGIEMSPDRSWTWHRTFDVSEGAK